MRNNNAGENKLQQASSLKHLYTYMYNNSGYGSKQADHRQLGRFKTFPGIHPLAHTPQHQ
jgi:hypothetical protein